MYDWQTHAWIRLGESTRVVRIPQRNALQIKTAVIRLFLTCIGRRVLIGGNTDWHIETQVESPANSLPSSDNPPANAIGTKRLNIPYPRASQCQRQQRAVTILITVPIIPSRMHRSHLIAKCRSFISRLQSTVVVTVIGRVVPHHRPLVCQRAY